MSYISDAHSVSRWDEESNEETYMGFRMSEATTGMAHEVVEQVKHGTLRQYEHVRTVNEDNFMKGEYCSSSI